MNSCLLVGILLTGRKDGWAGERKVKKEMKLGRKLGIIKGEILCEYILVLLFDVAESCG